MSTLYELTAEYDELLEMLYDDEEDEQTILDTLESIEGEIEDKADNYAKIIKDMDTVIAGIKREEERLNARRTALTNRKAWLKARLFDAMKETGKTKFKTDLFSFSIQKNGGKAPLIIEDPEAVPDDYLVPQPARVNNDAIRDALDHGVCLTFAHYGPRGESLIIR